MNSRFRAARPGPRAADSYLCVRDSYSMHLELTKSSLYSRPGQNAASLRYGVRVGVTQKFHAVIAHFCSG
jgi:hypothetical protein